MNFANAIGKIGGQNGTKFYLEYKDNEEVQQLVAQVPWGHNIILMEKVK
jgi:predicted nuclease of restriction endonuclease-like (RecB) superfamily